MDEQQQKIKKLIEDLGASQGLEVPGLNFNTVADNIARKDENFQKSLEPYSAQERRELVEKYKETIRDEVNAQIMTIKMAFAQVKDGIQLLTETVTGAIATIAIPPAIGTPPVLPNPAYALLEAKQKKSQLSSALNTLLLSFGMILVAATKIKFDLPDAVLDLLSALTATKSLIDTIPV